MIAHNLLLNDIKINSVLQLMQCNYGNSYYGQEDVINYLPRREGVYTLIPLQLLASMFGFSMEWQQHLSSVTVKRGKKEIILNREINQAVINGREISLPYSFVEENFDKVPLEFIIKVFGLEGQWINEETLSILDPLSLPYFNIFNKIHSPDTINTTYFADLDEDGIDEMCVSYFGSQLNLAVLKADGRWLYDDYLSGMYVHKFQAINLGQRKGLAAIVPCGPHASTVHVFSMTGSKLCLIDKFDPPGSGEIVNNEIHVISRLYDYADHGVKKVYSWSERENRFKEAEQKNFYWFNSSRINFQDAESVVNGFCDALALGLEDECLSYCLPEIKFSFPEDRLTYAIRHPLINIRRLVEQLKDKGEEKVLKVSQVDECSKRKVFLAYYDDYDASQLKNPSHVFRFVLQMLEEQWKLLSVNVLGDNMPAIIKWAPQLEFSAVFSICSMYTCFEGRCGLKNIELAVRDPRCGREMEIFIDQCTLIEVTETFPGVQISFFRENARICYFVFEQALEVEISHLQDQDNLKVLVTIPLKEVILPWLKEN